MAARLPATRSRTSHGRMSSIAHPHIPSEVAVVCSPVGDEADTVEL